MPIQTVTYVTSSAPKKEENKLFHDQGSLSDGTPVADRFAFEIRQANIKEVLEVDLRVMVQAEVASAYSQLKVPCIVEHAGLIFDDFRSKSYPGGLTKPMWNALGDQFIKETQSAGRRVVAQAVVAYCDGKSIRTFLGETAGTIADYPRGARDFYWDTIFMPDDNDGKPMTKTYAEIVADPALGLAHKVLKLSQSTRAMLAFLEHLMRVGPPELWA